MAKSEVTVHVADLPTVKALIEQLQEEIARLRAEPDDCVVKHCDEPATIGMTIVIAGLRIELDLCQEHFDLIEGGPQ